MHAARTFHPPPPGLRPYGAPGERLGDRLGDYVTHCLWSPGPRVEIINIITISAAKTHTVSLRSEKSCKLFMYLGIIVCVNSGGDLFLLSGNPKYTLLNDWILGRIPRRKSRGTPRCMRPKNLER